MRIAMIGPQRRDCGIADYTRALTRRLEERVEVVPVPIERAIEELPPLEVDAVHLQYEHAFFLAADDPAGNLDRFLDGLDRPTLLTMHCPPLDDSRWQRWLEAPHLAFHVFSRDDASHIVRRAPEATVFETAMPLPDRVEPHEPPERVRDRLTDHDGALLAIFGFVKAHKGHDTALAALELLPETTRLVIAGGPHDEDGAAFLAQLLATAARRGLRDRLHVTGYLEPGEVGAVLGAADLVLAPFHTVTASASVATAMSWERPLVASALPQLRQLEERWGTPCCVPPGDGRQLAAAVARLLEDPDARGALIRGARRARQHETFEHVAAACRRAYDHLACTTTAAS